MTWLLTFHWYPATALVSMAYQNKLNPLSSGVSVAFLHTGFLGIPTQRLTLESLSEQQCAAVYIEGRQPIVCVPVESCEWWSNGSQSHEQVAAVARCAYPIEKKYVLMGVDIDNVHSQQQLGKWLVKCEGISMILSHIIQLKYDWYD